MSKKGFSLIELLIYLSVFAVAAGMLTSVFTVFTRIQSRESAAAEVAEQISFLQNTIQRLVREASNIQNEAGAASSTIILRMANPALDPTIISRKEDGKIYLKQGGGLETSLISDRVAAAQFEAIKYENPGGHAVVQVDISLTYNNPGVYQQITRNLRTSIGRVTAATFDDHLVPGAAGPSYSLGSDSQRWQNLYLSGTVFLGNSAANPQNGAVYYDLGSQTFRGYQNGAWQTFSLSGGDYWALAGNNINNTNSGDVRIGAVGNSSFQYIQIDAENGVPPAADCDTDVERGKVMFNYTDNKIYICNGAGRGWDSVSLSN